MRRWMKTVPLRARTLLHRDNIEAELREEMQFHLEQRVDELTAQGVSREQAEQTARRELKMDRQMEYCRDARAGQRLEKLWADVAFGWRQLLKRRVTTAAAVLSLALAIGSSLAAFRLIDAIFLRSLPISHPERLYSINFQGVNLTGKQVELNTSFYPAFVTMRKAVKSEAELIGFSNPFNQDVQFSGGAKEKAPQQYVSGWMFSDFGLKPAAGRLLTENDDASSNDHAVVVLAYDYWQSRFGGNANVIGQTARINDKIYEIVGVAPKAFHGTGPASTTDIYLPLTANPLASQPDADWIRVFVHLRSDTNVAILSEKLQAADRMAGEKTVQQMLKFFPSAPKNLITLFTQQKLSLAPSGTGVSDLQQAYKGALVILSVLIAMVLLIACVNVANLMAGQAAARAREMAVRVSLGAGRGRLMRLVMVESAMMGMAAAFLGLLFSWWATPFVLRQIHPSNDPIPLGIGPDWKVTCFAFALTIGVTVIFGLVPALRAAHVQPVNALKGGERTPGGTAWMQFGIGAQVTFCTLVLFVTGLFVTSLVKLQNHPLGFSAERLLIVNTVTKYPLSYARWQQMADRIQTTPGVERASLETWARMSGSGWNKYISIGGAPWGKEPVYAMGISPGWLETMRVPLKSGRDLNGEDTAPGSAIVNETFAKMFFDGTNPLGKVFEFPANSKPGHPYTFVIVGVAGDAVQNNQRDPIRPEVYMPTRALNSNTGQEAPMQDATFEVRTAAEPEAMMQTLRTIMQQTDSSFRVMEMVPHKQLVLDHLDRERLLAVLGGFFAAIALLLAAIGLYGVLHYTVVQREKELGIRIALGAAAANIARVVTLRISAIVLVGMAGGMAGGVAAAKVVQALLYGVKSTDVSMMTVPGIVLLLAVVGSAIPAVLRAVRIDPASMLRAD